MYFFKAVLLIFNVVVSITAQNQQTKINEVSAGINEFTLKLLAQTSEEAGNDLNISLSPYTVWTLLTIISEGARGNTYRELEKVLGLPSNKNVLRTNYRSIANTLSSGGYGVTLDITNAIFTTNEYPLNKSFQQISQSVYGVNVAPLDFRNSANAVSEINRYIAKATRNRIPNFVNRDDVTNAAIFMTSALFFKGEWKHRFNKSATHLETFYDEAGNKKGLVEMMYTSDPFPYMLLTYLKAYAVELPYGDENKMSMIVILPRKGEKLSTVLRLMTQYPLSDLLDSLDVVAEEFDDDVEVYLPKFKMESELILNRVLNDIGIRDVLNSERADLLGIFPQYLYLSRVLQKAVIDVDEEGTVATAASGGSFVYKTTQPKFVANKPFAFLIVDKRTRSAIFAGKITNPNGICDKCRGN